MEKKVDQYELFKERYMITKKDIEERIKKEISDIIEKAKVDAWHSAAYYHVLQELVDRFNLKLEKTILFEKLEDGWKYDYDISDSGMYLYLHHCNIVDIEEKGELWCEVDQEFTLLEEQTRLLTVEEYADKYDTEVGTVRQWIRRGKIRNAQKFGKEWRIPEFTDVPRRGYLPAAYRWKEELDELPEKYSFLNDYGMAFFRQDEKERNIYYMTLMEGKNSVENKTFEYNVKERECIEIFLISHPKVKYIQNFTEGLIIDYMNMCHKE